MAAAVGAGAGVEGAMMNAQRTSEMGMPHFERHAAWRNREIFQWTYAPDGTPCREYPAPHICGATWRSAAQREAFYRRQREAGYPLFGGHLGARDEGFVAYSDPFASWEDAERWLFVDGEGNARAGDGR